MLSLAQRTATVPETGTIRIEELPMGEVGFRDLAAHFAAYPGFALLDSRTRDGGLGRFSLLSFAPFARLRTRGQRIVHETRKGRRALRGDPFAALAERLARHRVEPAAELPVPFVGGAIGYLSYETGRLLETLPARASDVWHLPDLCFGFYDFALVQSHDDGRVFFCGTPPGAAEEGSGVVFEWVLDELARIRPGLYRPPVGEPPAVDGLAGFSADFTPRAYRAAVGRAKELIFAGDVYQVNLTQRFTANVADVPPFDLYRHLMALNPAPFAAYLELGDHQVLSSSPERFLRSTPRWVETRPIKGTIARGITPREDVENRRRLLGSEKDRAELAMIVDLMRNDLGRVCKPGSIRVGQFPRLETYASVHHLVTTVSGELARGKTVVDLLSATFPGGSITGAPKIRAMEIIDELEPVARGVYTGSIGYLGFDGRTDLNIAIRTMILKNGVAAIHAGGGVVADSDEAAEYEESLLKAEKLLQAVRWARGS